MMMKPEMINMLYAIRFFKLIMQNVLGIKQLLIFLDNNLSGLPEFLLETVTGIVDR